MSSWLREALEKPPQRERPAGHAPDNVIPIGAAARELLDGLVAPGTQRARACACARNLQSAGYSLDDAADMIFDGLSNSEQSRDPWTWQEAYDLTESIYTSEAPPLPPFDEVEVVLEQPLTEAPEQAQSGDGYSLRFKEFDLLVEVSRIEFGKDIFCWMKVTRAGAVVGEKHIDLSSPSGFNQVTRYLAARDAKLPWPAIMDAVSCYVLNDIRQGDPTVVLNTVERTERPLFRLDPLIREGMPNLFYGMGGSGKSLLLYYLGLLVQSGTSSADFKVNPGNVLLLDWELDAETVLPIIESLASSLHLERSRWALHYKRSAGTLTEEAENIGLYIQQHDIKLVLIDSLGRACGGDKNSQEVVQRMFGAMRRWPPVTIACLDHVAKPQGKKKADTPYGSVYTLNEVRSAFMVEGDMEDGSNELYMSIKQTKRNFGPVPPIGLRFQFLPSAEQPTAIKVTRDSRQLQPAHERILAVLKSRPPDEWMTASEVAAATGMDPDVTRKRLEEMGEDVSRRKRKTGTGTGRNPYEYGI